MESPHVEASIIAYSQLLAQSFFKLTQRTLLDAQDNSEAAEYSRLLYHAPFALVAHGTEADPVFCYANVTAQRLWGLTWTEFTRMPSRLSAEPLEQSERQQLLNEASQKGYVEHFKGVRITKNGRRFRIEDTLLWNIVDQNGIKHGQAALIKKWDFL